MGDGDYCTLADVKGWLGLTVNTADIDLQKLVSGMSAAMQEIMSRNFLAASYNETRNGPGGDRIVVANSPIVSVTSVTVDGNVITPAPVGTGAGWVNDDRTIYLRGYLFTRGVQNVQLVYTGGYNVIPLDIGRAATMWCAYLWKNRDHIGQVSKIINGETVTFSTKDMPDEVTRVLRNRSRVAPI